MKFALLGIDREALSLVRDIAHSDAHQLRCFSDGNPPATKADLRAWSEIRQLCPLAEELANWEVLLGGGNCDAVIVAGSPEVVGRFEQLRRLVQEAVPVVVTQPPPVTLLEAYELEMVRQESRGVVVPLLPWHWLGWAKWWAGLFHVAMQRGGSDAALGRVDQITFERRLEVRSRQSVIAQLARDIDYIRLMCGEITQVAALGAVPTGNGSQPDFSALAVQMTGPSGILVRWSVASPDDRPAALITVAGSNGKNRLEIPDDAWSAVDAPRFFPSGSSEPQPLGRATMPPDNLPDLVAEQVRSSSTLGDHVDRALHPTWPDTIRSLELVEAVEKSLRKGRTISVGVEGRSETDAFKGTMASMGCALLVVGLVLMVVAAVALKVAQKAGNQLLVDIFRWWPAALVGLFVLFLLLQLFRFIIPRPQQPGKPTEPEAPPRKSVDV